MAASGDMVEYQSRSAVTNEPDEYALEEALALRGKRGGQVTVISMCPPQSEDILRTALAKGADQAIRIDGNYSDADRTSLLLAETIRGLEFDLILAGTESLDNMASQVAVAVGSRLGIPFVFGVTSVALSGTRTATVTKELGGGSYEVLEVGLPALLCVQTGTQRLSFVPFAKLVQARRRPIQCISIGDLRLGQHSLDGKPGFGVLDVFRPKSTHAIEMLSGSTSGVASRVTDIIERAR